MNLPRTPPFRLDGKRAVVVGGSRGIGFGCAVALAEAGAHVIVAARGATEVQAAVNEMAQAGFSTEAQLLDVTDLDAVRDAFDVFGPIDILVNSAGSARHSPALLTTPDDYDAVSAINIRAAYFLAQTAAKQMIGRGGSIIQISSQMGQCRRH